MSIGALLGMAKTALQAHQQAVEVTGHNIANAETEGYTRQRLNLTPETPLRRSYGSVGRGVTIDGIVRQRSSFLDLTFRQESSTLGRHGTLRDKLGQIEAIVGEPSENGLAGAMDRLFAAFNDLSNAPSDGAIRTVLRAQASEVARTFRRYDELVVQVQSNTEEEVLDTVKTMNTLADEIASLNPRIVESEASGRPANDLRDQRDLALDRLSRMIPVRGLEQSDGSVSVVAGDTLLVDRGIAQHFELRGDANGETALGIVGSARTFVPSGGSISGLLDTMNVHAPGFRAQLDEIAAALVTEVNALHRTGTTTTGAVNVDFFDPDGLTAEGIGLSLMVQQSTGEIAAGRSGAAGDGSLALELAQLRTVGVVSLDGLSIHEGYNQVVTGLGVAVLDADRIAQAQDVLVTNIEGQRAGMHGVSVDEEMVGLISHQQAYTAAARLVTTADEMLQELLNMV